LTIELLKDIFVDEILSRKQKDVVPIFFFFQREHNFFIFSENDFQSSNYAAIALTHPHSNIKVVSEFPYLQKAFSKKMFSVLKFTMHTAVHVNDCS